MNQELISVIIPTCNRTDTLKRAIDSVIKQTYKNIEIIIIDDNSDNSKAREEVNKIVQMYQNIKLIQNHKKLGGGLSRNVGIEQAKGKFIAFLDDDDEFLETKIEKQYNLYKQKNNQNIGMIYCYVNRKKGKKTTKRKVDYEGIPLKEHIIEYIATTSLYFCPKDVLVKIGGFDDVTSHQDAILLFKILKSGYEIYRVPEILVNYYIHKDTRISKFDQEWINTDIYYRELCRKEKFSKKDMEEIEYSFSRRIAKYSIRINNKKLADKEIKNMIRIDLLNIETLKAIIKIFFRPMYMLILKINEKMNLR